MAKIKGDDGPVGWIKSQAISLREAFRDFKDRLAQERSIRLMAIFALIVAIMSMVVLSIERRHAAGLSPGEAKNWIDSLGKAVYWMFVSGATVGYGDLYPHTDWGRAVTVVVIISSMALTSILTATIASWLVEKRIMEGRGMEKIGWRGHTIVCGWNVNAKSLIESIYRDTRDSEQVALINNLPEEQVSELLYQYKRQGLRFVRGDFVHESVLERANLSFARAVVILADGEVGGGFQSADQRTVLCSLAIKSINPQIIVAAELVDRENVPHLRRAQVDHVVVIGERNDFLLAAAVTSPGVTLAAQDLFDPRVGDYLQQAKIPTQLVDQTFADLYRHFRDKRGAMAIGVVSKEETGMTLNDLLSEDMSAIDHFIKRQFEGLEEDYFFKGAKMQIKINPSDDYRIQRNDWALLIAAAPEGPSSHGGKG